MSPIGFGIEYTGLEWMAVVTLAFVGGGFALLLLRTIQRRQEVRRVVCPETRAPVSVTLNRAFDGAYDSVAECSRWGDSRPAGCHEGCLPKAG
jgi:hypothetical protein